MPEGDTLYRIAQTLAPALVGQPVKSLVLPRSDVPTAHLVGRSVKKIESVGKNLLIHFDEGSTLHVHLRMNGTVRLRRERPGVPPSLANASFILTVPGWVALCQRAPTVRLFRSRDLPLDRRLQALGPDLLGASFDRVTALRRLRARNGEPLGVAIMDQTAVAGVGNVYKCEVLFNLHFDPFAPGSAYSDEELLAMLDLSRALLQKNVVPRDPDKPPDAFTRAFARSRVTRSGCEVGKGPVSVYGRQGRACFDCGATILMERQGELRRSTYYCPVCQPKRNVVSAPAAAADPSSSRGA